MKSNKMKAIVARSYGGPDVYKSVEMEIPVPADDEVLIRVHAASATTADTMMRSGKPYFGRLMTGLRMPKHPVPGSGFAGIVSKVGKDAKDFSIGDRVFGETTLGFSTNAEYVKVPANGVILKMPEGMEFDEAAVFGDGPVTSLNFLREIAKVKEGQKVLINGASGSLSTAAVQLAVFYGAEVTAVTSSRNRVKIRPGIQAACGGAEGYPHGG